MAKKESDIWKAIRIYIRRRKQRRNQNENQEVRQLISQVKRRYEPSFFEKYGDTITKAITFALPMIFIIMIGNKVIGIFDDYNNSTSIQTNTTSSIIQSIESPIASFLPIAIVMCIGMAVIMIVTKFFISVGDE